MKPLVVPGTLDSLSDIAEYIKQAAMAAGLDKKAGYHLRLAVDEVATNIVMHGYDEAGLEGVVNVRAEIDEKTLRIYLEDTAIPYNPLEQKRPDSLNAPLENRQIGGLGVFLAIKNVDGYLYEYVDGCNRNIFVMNRGDV